MYFIVAHAHAVLVRPRASQGLLDAEDIASRSGPATQHSSFEKAQTVFSISRVRNCVLRLIAAEDIDFRKGASATRSTAKAHEVLLSGCAWKDELGRIAAAEIAVIRGALEYNSRAQDQAESDKSSLDK